MAKKEDNKATGKDPAGAQNPGPDDDQGPKNGEIQTVEDLESCYPQLVTAIRDEVVLQVGSCTAKQVQANMPELYERIVTELQGRGGPNLNVPGFLLEFDDPFAQGTLDRYQGLMGLDGLRLPYVVPFKGKGRGDIHEDLWTAKFEKTEALETEFKNVAAYIAFKSKIITQVLEFYILVAEGAGDYVRAKAARRAMKKIK